MLPQYTYLKTRQQFGKQCVFSVAGHIAEENILPEPDRMHNYIIRSYSNRGIQVSSQLAAHNAQTNRTLIANTGIMHSEGGWPKDVNAKDAEVVQRYRRRVEKDDSWPIYMGPLLSVMERYLHQNNAVNIYQNYFDDLIPTSMVREYNIRVTNLYEDPKQRPRPIRYLSWSSSDTNRLAVAYGFEEFEEHPADVSPYSYIWDIANPNKAIYTLKPDCPLMTLEFNNRDPVLLISGLRSGQVCCWDLRTSHRPAFLSHPYNSHKFPAIQTLWITSKTNTEFFSSSSDGTILWWDIRHLQRPSDTLVMDLQYPERASILNAVGVKVLQFEPTMSSKFLAGTENGIVVVVNRRTEKPVDKLAIRIECYTGPVITIERNPLYMKNFLTIGDWSARLWADDTKEGCFFTTNEKSTLSGGCWSQLRCSVFFTINTEGILEAFDILTGLKAPQATIRVCRDKLTVIKPHEDGEYLAVGSQNGNVYLLECSEDFLMFTKTEKAVLSNYFERCSKYEKAIESRMKEIRLTYSFSHDIPIPIRRESKGKESKKKELRKEKKKERRSILNEKDSRRRSKTLKKRKSSVRTSFAESVEAELDYYNRVEEEAAKYTKIDPSDLEAAMGLLRERTAPKVVEEEAESEKEELRKRRPIRTMKSRLRPTRPARKSSVYELKEEIGEYDSDLEVAKGKKLRSQKIVRKACPPFVVCKPEICCKDLEEKRQKARMLKKLSKDSESEEEIPVKEKPFNIESQWFRRISDYISQIPQPSQAIKAKILAMKNAPPTVLRRELQKAKREVRIWQDKAIARKLCSSAIEKCLRDGQIAVDTGSSKYQQMMSSSEIDKLTISTSKIEEAKLPVPQIKKPSVPVKLRPRKSRKVKVLDEEEITRQQEEKRWELFEELKKKVKQYERKQKRQLGYPRVSAAFVRTSSELLDAAGKVVTPPN